VRGESVKQYVTTARSKGLTEAGIGIKHILRNAAIPVLTLALYDLSRIFVGTAIVVEVVFSWPGIGRLAVGAVERGDIDLVQAIVIIGATTVAAFNLLADLLYFRLDPRTRVMVRGS
jgi:peptide/nickel transport system permease protein